MRPPARPALLLVALAFAAGACAAPADEPAAAADGRVIVGHLPPRDPALADYARVLRASGEIEAVAADVEAEVRLPRDLNVLVMECGTSNAFYDPGDVAVVLCLELVQTYTEVLTAPDDPREVVEDEMVYSALFTLYHELGHALVDQLELPIVGRQEDVVDEFAAVLLLDMGDVDAVLAGMDQFDVDAEQEGELDAVPYWGVHGLSEQRLYNLACFVYGSDPEEFADFVASGELPEERAATCPAEYEQKLDSWARLLSPHRRP